MLKQIGVDNVEALLGGFTEWKTRGLPVASGM